jgi:membrane-associated phospholipid phosphatase
MPPDHALVRFLEENYRRTAVWAWVDIVFRPEVLLAAMMLLGLAAWLRRRCGSTVPPWLDDLRIASVVAVVALVIAAALKILFGRSWPDPAHVQQGVDNFRWFAGEWTPHRGAFPSATACASAAAAALWRRASTLRAPAAATAALFGAIVVIQEYHWFSDALAGVLLGIAIARAMPSRFV